MKVSEFFSQLEFTNKFLKELGRADIELVYFNVYDDYSIKSWDDYVDFLNEKFDDLEIQEWKDAEIELSDDLRMYIYIKIKTGKWNEVRLPFRLL